MSENSNILKQREEYCKSQEFSPTRISQLINSNMVETPKKSIVIVKNAILEDSGNIEFKNLNSNHKSIWQNNLNRNSSNYRCEFAYSAHILCPNPSCIKCRSKNLRREPVQPAYVVQGSNCQKYPKNISNSNITMSSPMKNPK